MSLHPITDPLVALRGGLVAELKARWQEGQRELEASFLANPTPNRYLRERARLVDRLLQDALQPLTEALPGSEALAVVAIGGYGRRELFPYSDIDVMLLLPDGAAAESAPAKLAESLLYVLWDIGFKIGQSVRTLDDALSLAKEDITVRTGLLEARLVAGNRALYSRFTRNYARQIQDGSEAAFIRDKMAEREERHARTGDSRYLLEPNLKDGKGGLRDIQTIGWLARYCYRADRTDAMIKAGVFEPGEVKRYRAARRFVNLVRQHIHHRQGRANERLTFELQREIAEAMGYRDQDKGGSDNAQVERFMKRYFLIARDIGTLTRTLLAALERDGHRQPLIAGAANEIETSIGRYFIRRGRRLDYTDGQDIAAEPWLMLEIFWQAHLHGLRLQPEAWARVARTTHLQGRALRKDSRINDRLLDMVLHADAEHLLRQLSEVGLLGKLIPAFGKLTGQMQFDMYHTYTTDEHILRALGNLHAIARGRYRYDMPLASRIIHHVQQRRPMFLGILCHDIAKGIGGNHAARGASIARRMAKRFGFNNDEIATVAWLVTHHQTLTEVAFTRDIDDPKTIEDLACSIRTPDRLRMLLCITVADIRAVGPSIWNGWKGALLRGLYERVAQQLGSDAAPAKIDPDALSGQLVDAQPALPQAAAQAFIRLAPTLLLLRESPDVIARMALLWHRKQQDSEAVSWQLTHDRFSHVSELLVATADAPGLFAALAGVMAGNGVQVTDAKAYTLADGTALDRLHGQTQGGEMLDDTAFRPKLELAMAELPAALAQRSGGGALATPRLSDPGYRLPQMAFYKPPKISIVNDDSAEFTILEITSIDRPGLLHVLAATLHAAGLNIAGAHIATYGEEAVDVFYVKDRFGQKLHHADRSAQLTAAIEAALAPPEATGSTGMAGQTSA